MNTMVELTGLTGSGKTSLLYALNMYLKDNARVGRQTGGGLPAALSEGERYRRALPLIPRRADPASAKNQEEYRADEWVQVRLREGEFKFQSIPLDEFAKPDTPQDVIVDRFTESRDRILAVTVNPFLCDSELAERALLELLATIQRTFPSASLHSAVGYAADLLFHLDSEELSTLSRIGYGHADAEELWKRGDPRLLVRGLLGEERVRYEIEFRSLEGFEDQETAPDLPQCSRRLREALRDIAHRAVAVSSVRRNPIRYLLPRIPNAVVVLTHLDLLRFMTTVNGEEFDRVLRDLFGPGKTRVCQRILGSNSTVQLEPSGPDTVRITTVHPVSEEASSEQVTTAERFLKSVMSLNEHRDPPPPPPHAETGPPLPLVQYMALVILALLVLNLVLMIWVSSI